MSGRPATDGRNRTVVLGLGNVMNRDEGVGIFCLEPLREILRDSPDVEVLDGGVLGLGLLPLVESCGRLLVLDAVDAGSPPGAIIELAKEEIPLFSRLKLSWHQVGFQEVLELAKVRGLLPERLRLLGVQPAEISVGYGLSPAIEAVVPKLAARAVRILEEWKDV